MTDYVIVGCQHGDERKNDVGKYMAAGGMDSQPFDLVIKPVGGNDSFLLGEERVQRTLLPSAMYLPDIKCIIGSGAFIDANALVENEITPIERLTGSLDGRLWISDRSHLLITDLYERIAEEHPLIGNGLAFAYNLRGRGHGIRMGDTADNTFERKLSDLVRTYGFEPTLSSEIFKRSYDTHSRLQGMIGDTTSMLYDMLYGLNGKEKPRILIQASKGTEADIVFGEYPSSGSYDATAAACIAGSGIGPGFPFSVIGVATALVTRGGDGPLLTEIKLDNPEGLDDKTRKILSQRFSILDGERVGWPDVNLISWAVKVNNITKLALMGLDKLSGIDIIKIATGYTLEGENLSVPPASMKHMKECRPVYQEIVGWDYDLSGIESYKDLPPQTQSFVTAMEHYIEKSVGRKVPVTMVGVSDSDKGILRR